MLKSEELQFILYLKGFSAFCSQKSAVDFFSFSHLPTVEFKVEYILTFFPQNLNCGKLWKTVDTITQRKVRKINIVANVSIVERKIYII